MARVLIVEDDPALSRLYDTIFKREGFETLIARDGQEGFDLATTKGPDFILSDVEVPKMTGLAMYEKILATSKDKKIPIIFLTGKDPQSDGKQIALRLGAVEYLAKGVDSPEEIAQKVKTYLNIN